RRDHEPELALLGEPDPLALGFAPLGLPSGVTTDVRLRRDGQAQSATNRPNEREYKALLVHGTERVACTTAQCSGCASEHVDWVLSPNTHYLRADGVTLVGTTNDLGLWSFP